MLWDIFCRVIDNHGDLGVCWRMSADLAKRGHHVRLWVDDATALTWMAPEAKVYAQGLALDAPPTGQVIVRPWALPLQPQDVASDVWIEAFGCNLPEHFLAWANLAQSGAENAPNTPSDPSAQVASWPVWLNLEYLSAESYVERSHRLPSPVMSGPLKGRTKWFFYPGFTHQTGGLIREPQIEESIRSSGLTGFEPATSQTFPKRSTLFCYEPAALAEALQLASLNKDGHQWQVAHGRGALAFEAAYKQALRNWPQHLAKPSFHLLPPVSQTQFDQVLASSDLNFVRGEDSLVRAMWAGKAFVWQIYPQDDGAHGAKLNAFLDWLQAPESLRRFHLRWNGLSQEPLPQLDLASWQACALAARERLMQQMDLVSQLLQFVAEKR
jgi:uncharacterized repeat protein (TIGR03837 family)